MSIGYSLTEAAQMRKKNRQFIAIKNMLIFVLTLLCFFIVGYGIAFGDSSVGIVGG
jgi:ammonia channel protein AmtB